MHSFVTTAFTGMLSFAVGGIALAEMKEKWDCGLRLVLLIKVLFEKAGARIANNVWSGKRRWRVRYTVTIRLR